MCGFNEAWRFWIVAESLADLTNHNFEDGIADKSVRPDGVQEIIFGDELARMSKKMVKHCEGFGSELDRLRPSPQLLVSQVQAKGIEDDVFFVPHSSRRTLQKFYARLMTCPIGLAYCRPKMEGWQHKLAFVITVSTGNRY